MRRREFVKVSGGAVIASPFTAHAQKQLPVVGFLHSGAPAPYAAQVDAFRAGLADQGFVEGRNVTIAFRWAENQTDRLPAMATELVAKNVAIIASGGGELPLLAARGATKTIPIVATMGGDPVAAGHVVSLARPGGNVTGISFLTVELMSKRVGLLLEMAPRATGIALLVNPRSPTRETVIKLVGDTAAKKSKKVVVLPAATSAEIETALSALDRTRADTLVVQADPFFVNQRTQLAELTLRLRLAAIHEARAFVAAGGLASYGADLLEVYRLTGQTAGKVLRGAKASDLAVQQSVKFDMALNLKTAKALGLTISPLVLAQADEVIE